MWRFWSGKKAQNLHFGRLCLRCLAFQLQPFLRSLSSPVLLPFAFQFILIQLQRGGSIWACLWNNTHKRKKKRERETAWTWREILFASDSSSTLPRIQSIFLSHSLTSQLPALPPLPLSVSALDFQLFPSLILQRSRSGFRADLAKSPAEGEREGQREEREDETEREIVSEGRPDRDRGNQSF